MRLLLILSAIDLYQSLVYKSLLLGGSVTPIAYYQLIERSLDAQLRAARRNDWDMVERIHRVVRLALIKHFRAMLAARLTLSEAENQIIAVIVERITAKDKELFDLIKANNHAISPERLH